MNRRDKQTSENLNGEDRRLQELARQRAAGKPGPEGRERPERRALARRPARVVDRPPGWPSR
jgi:hypothetical protein